MHKIKAMKLANIIYPVFSIMFSLCLFSCNNDDDDYNGGGGNSENRNDYTVTESVKSAKLEDKSILEESIIIYDDFNCRYSLLLYNGHICMSPQHRYNGGLVSNYDPNGTESGIHDTGKVNNLQSVTGKEKVNDKLLENNIDSRYKKIYQCSVVQPGHGYSAYFTTGEGEMKFVRIYIKDYTLNQSGSLNSITIQYQLY